MGELDARHRALRLKAMDDARDRPDLAVMPQPDAAMGDAAALRHRDGGAQRILAEMHHVPVGDHAQGPRLPQLPILASLVLDSRQQYDGQGADGGVTLILVGNEKGGAGKSTVTAHLALAFPFLGRRVATVDLDSRQQTMTRFFANRAMFADRLPLALPYHRLAVTSNADSVREARAEEIAWPSESLAALAELRAPTRSVAAIERESAAAVAAAA